MELLRVIESFHASQSSNVVTAKHKTIFLKTSAFQLNSTVLDLAHRPHRPAVPPNLLVMIFAKRAFTYHSYKGSCKGRTLT